VAVIDHFDLRGITLIGHSLGTRELVRYLTRHGDDRITRMVLVAPTTPQLRRSAENPGGWDPAVLDANYAAVAANVPQWCTSFEAAPTSGPARGLRQAWWTGRSG
jgi:non-heme chloroperoxidase